MPYYNPMTDKIENCEKGTLSWLHERGHQIFFGNSIVKEIDMSKEWFLVGAITFLCLDMNSYALIFLFIFLLWMLVAEAYAWGYTFLNLSKLKKAKRWRL
jgi:hypothetical protein